MKILRIIFLLVLFNSMLLWAQRAAVLSEIEELITQIRLNRGDVLYKEKFFDLKQEFEEIKDQVSNRPLTLDEENKLQELRENFVKINGNAQRIFPLLSELLLVRDEAVANDAEELAPKQFSDAEKKLSDLVEQLERRSNRNLDDRINQGIKLYRQAQFEAIRNKLLSEVRIFMHESRELGAEKWAPHTLALVNTLLQEVEDILDKKRFSDPGLQEKASRLSEESQHLLFLTQLAKKVYKDDQALEDFLLQIESALHKIAADLGYNPKFSQGILPVLRDLDLTVQALQEENRSLHQKNAELKDSNRLLQDEIIRLRNQLRREQNLTQKFQQLESSLKPMGAVVDQSDHTVSIHLNGIHFEPGRTTVPDQYMDKLKQIGNALRIFSEYPILIRLTQAGSNNVMYSQAMAEQRAKNVALIIQTAGFINEERIRFQGALTDVALQNGHAILDIFIDIDR
ncbi:MAG: hypothetical protein Kow0042_22660 [Calditrichia bacterium]